VMLHTAVALSVVLGFLVSELAGILTGGLISAGYLAFYFNEPLRLLSTLVLAIVICLIVKGLKNVLILFGRRRFMLTIMVSIIFVFLIERFYYAIPVAKTDLRVIGYVVPGLIANDMDKQGILKTSLSLCAVVLVIRLIIMVAMI